MLIFKCDYIKKNYFKINSIYSKKVFYFYNTKFTKINNVIHLIFFKDHAYFCDIRRSMSAESKDSIKDIRIGTSYYYDRKRFKIVSILYDEQLNFSINHLVSNTNPFDASKKGPVYKIYSHVALLECSFMKVFYYFSDSVKTIKDNQKYCTNFCDLIRNKYIFYSGFELCCKKIEDGPSLLSSDFDNLYNNDGENKDFVIENISINKTVHSSFINICYDIETVIVDGELVPFLICAKQIQPLFFKHCSIMEEDCDHLYESIKASNMNDFFIWHWNYKKFNKEEMFDEAGKSFRRYIESFVRAAEEDYVMDVDNNDEPETRPQNLELRIFGFNNNNFDNHFIFKELRKMYRFELIYHSRFGKITSCVLKKANYISIHICDLIKWLPDKSLKEACEDYEIESTKLDVDILRYGRLCNHYGGLIFFTSEETIQSCIKNYSKLHNKLIKEFKKEGNIQNSNYDIFGLITKYCKVDVLATIELYNKIKESVDLFFLKLNSADIKVPFSDFMKYVSVPQLSFSILTQTLRLKNEKFIFFKNHEITQTIFGTYFGGRCDFTFIGEYIGISEILYYDVTSEYSLAMTGLFPSVIEQEDVFIGYEINIQFIQNIINQLQDQRRIKFEEKTLHVPPFNWMNPLDKIKGIFLCNIYIPNEPSQLSTWSPIPTRFTMKNGSQKLIFSNFNQEKRFLNTVHIRSLIFAGWKIEILEHYCNLFFTRTAQLFKPFVDLIGSLKTEARGENKSFAKLLKLVLNSAQGKIGQKPTHLIHRHKGKVVKKDVYEISENAKELLTQWDRSYHYLATFIGAEANWILWSAAYLAELEQIYDKKTIEQRVGTILYCDTDSILFDSSKISTFLKFNCSEKIGEWNIDNNMFDTTWKKKYKNIDSMIVLSKKCYFLLAKKELKNIKLKGLVRREAESIKYDQLKQLCDGKPITFNFTGLVKKTTIATEYGDEKEQHTYNQDIIKSIHEEVLKKTIKREEISAENIVRCDDEKVYEKNKHNLKMEKYNDEIKHFLTFTCSLRTDVFQSRKLDENNEFTKFFDDILYNDENF